MGAVAFSVGFFLPVANACVGGHFAFRCAGHCFGNFCMRWWVSCCKPTGAASDSCGTSILARLLVYVFMGPARMDGSVAMIRASWARGIWIVQASNERKCPARPADTDTPSSRGGRCGGRDQRCGSGCARSCPNIVARPGLQ
jgi:hypothetical protein